jgi:diguanylate cyclase (GGDEF)-like protein
MVGRHPRGPVSAPEIQTAQLIQYCSNLPTAVASGELIALIYALSVWSFSSHTLVLLWFCAATLSGLWRIYLWLRHRRVLATDPEAMYTMLVPLRVSSLATGLMWGSAAVLLYSASVPASQLLLAFTLGGVTAAAANSMVADRAAAMLFQTATLLPLTARLLAQGDAAHVGVGLMSLLYLGFLAITVRRLNGQLVESIAMRLEGQFREHALLESERRYRELAQTDALTNLPNRHSLHQSLPQLLRVQGPDETLALMYLDVDNFKDLNDSRGHGFGDRILVGVAQRLLQGVRPGDLVVRMGGDEFVIVARDVGGGEQAEHLARNILQALEQPITVDGHSARVRASIGIGLYPQDGRDAEQLLKNADIALYQAKSRGRGRLELFAAPMNDTLRERVFLEHELRLALQSDQLYMEYQPLVDLHSDRPPELEALVRWRHPQRGSLSPTQFIPVAEHCGLMGALGEVVLRRVCQQLQTWQAELVPLVPVSVNVSAHQFEDGSLIQRITDVTREYQVDLKLLRVEITESALMQHSAKVLETLHALRAMGIKISIDDFGTGYSSLSYLKNLPVDCMKIDRSFIHDMTSDARDVALVRGIVAIAKSLAMRVVAEGVETRRQAALLHDLNCDAAQGYFFHRPLSVADCTALLKTLSSRRPIADTLRAPQLQAVGHEH